MGWFWSVFRTGPQTFEQDLERLVAKWSQPRQGKDAVPPLEVAAVLSIKSRQLLRAENDRLPEPAEITMTHTEIQP